MPRTECAAGVGAGGGMVAARGVEMVGVSARECASEGEGEGGLLAARGDEFVAGVGGE